MEGVQRRRKLALVLSGGGLRSAAQVGALKTLEEFGIRPDCVIGTSGGAIVAALYASGLSPGEIEAVYLSIIGKERQYLDFPTGDFVKALCRLDLSPVKGIVKGDRLRQTVHKNLRYLKHFANFSTLPRPVREKVLDLYLTSVDINDGREVVFCPPRAGICRGKKEEGFTDFRCCSDMLIADAVRASIGIPGVFVPFAHKGRHYVDGGLRDNLPLAVAVKLAGADEVLAIDLGYAGLRKQDLVNNGVVDILSQSIDIMGMDQLAADLLDKAITHKPVIVLNPMIYDVGLLDTEHIPAMILRGQLLVETYLKTRGLRRESSPILNRALLFKDIKEPVLYPTKYSPVYATFRRQITSSVRQESKKSWLQSVLKVVQRFRGRLLAGGGLVMLALGLVLIWGDPILLQAGGGVLLLAGIVALYYGLLANRKWQNVAK